MLLKVQELWYDNLHIISEVINNDSWFNKAKLLNHGLEIMRQDFDFVSIVDLDILYRDNFFDTIVEQVNTSIYFVSSGFKLNKEGSDKILGGWNFEWSSLNLFIDEHERELNHKRAYPSQVTLSNSLYNRLIKVLGTLYCDELVGWGGEDSALSLLSYALERAGVFKKVYDFDMWYHLHHQRMQEFDKEMYDRNVQIMKNWVNYYKAKVGEFRSG